MEEKRGQHQRRESDVGWKDIALRMSTMESRMDTFEVSHKKEYSELRAEVAENTRVTNATFVRLSPYVSNFEAIDKFTAALSTVGDGINWFIRTMGRWLKPVMLLATIGLGIYSFVHAWRTGAVVDILIALTKWMQ